MKAQRFTEVCILDVCMSDYFTGYHMPVLSIPMYNGMTNKDLAEEINSSINSDWDYLVNESDRSYTEEEIKIFEAHCTELLNDPDNVIYEDSEEPEDMEDYESAYMYLGLCKPVTKYGITWLNE